MKQAKWLVIPAILLLFGWFWSVMSEESDLHGYGGQFNLTTSLPTEDKVALNGHWLYYPYQLVEPSETVFGGYDVRLIEVPHSTSVNEFGTYQTDLYLPPESVGELLSLYIPNLGNAFKVWVNNDLLVEEGQVGASRDTTLPAKSGHVIDFISNERTVTLTIQVANHYLRTGGLWSNIYVGSDEAIERSYTIDKSLTLIVFGSLIILLLYYVFSFIVQGRDLYHLYFSVLVMFVMARLLLEGDKVVFDFLPQFPWEWSVKFEYLSFLWLLPLFAYVISFTYSKQANITFNRLYFVGTLIASFVILLTPSYVYTQYLVFFQLTLVVGFVYIFKIIWQAYKNQERYAFINIVGLFVLLMTAINDAFYYNEWINSKPILSVGFLFYLFIQTIILAVQHARTVEQFKASSEELKVLNVHLEEKVDSRTKELEKSQKELLEKNRFLQKISYLDELTHIPNRRSFANVLEKDLEEAQTKGESIALLLIDLDLFKKINDQYGHQMGDACLKIFAELLSQHFSEMNSFVARYGGEEFVAISRGLMLDELVDASNQLREKVLNLKVPGVSQGELTVSIGISFAEKAKTTGDALFEQADAALYKAKDAGRNRVVVYEE